MKYSRHDNGVTITNSVEGYLADVRRGINGIYRHVSKQHLHRYLSKLDFRYNAHKVKHGERTLLTVKGVDGKTVHVAETQRPKTIEARLKQDLKVSGRPEMPRRHPDRMRGDVREFPRYSIPEAAFYVRVPATTLRAWTLGQDYTTRTGVHRTFKPVIELADTRNKLLSFYNLVEAHILRFTTEVRGLPFENVRRGLNYVHQTIPGKHPLLTRQFETSGKELFVEVLGRTINATAQGQYAMREILQSYLALVPRDAYGFPIKIFPINSRRLAIDPMFSSGKPIVKGRGIAASVLWGRSKSGESVLEIARDYGLTEIEAQEAIEDYEWRAAA